MRRTILIGIMAILWLDVLSQQAASSIGGDGKGLGGTFSYTAGQVDYISAAGATGAIALGVQQVFQVVGEGPNYQVLIFPNPAELELTIRLSADPMENYQYFILDMFGQVMTHDKILAKETHIPLGHYSPAPYILQLMINDEVKSYKIVKTGNR